MLVYFVQTYLNGVLLLLLKRMFPSISFPPPISDNTLTVTYRSLWAEEIDLADTLTEIIKINYLLKI